MSTDALSIITHAEYLALSKNGRNNHRVNSILARLYLLCAAERPDEARLQIDELYRVIHQDASCLHPA